MHKLSAAVALAILAFTIGSRLYVGPQIVDDAYITFRMSRNLAHGEGFTYNPSQRVQATTAPLFAATIAIGAAAGIPPERFAPLLSIAADLVSIWMILLIFSGAGQPVVGWCAAALLAISPFFLTYSVSGLETSIFVALQLSAAVASGRGRDALAAAVAAAGTLVRPDGALMLAVTWVRSVRSGVRSSARTAAIALAILLPWAVFSAWYFGTIVPQSISAKHATSASILVSLRSLRVLFLSGTYALLTPIAVAGALVWSWRNRDSAVRIWFAWTVAYLAVFSAAGALTHFPWYFVPMLPAYFAGVAIAIVCAVDVVMARYREPVVAAAAAGILILGAIRLPAHARLLVDLQNQRERLYLAAGVRLAQRGSRCVLAATEIGAVGYGYPGPVLDLIGLASPEAVGQPMTRSLERAKAAWLVSYDTHLDPALRNSSWFLREFHPIWSHPVSAGRTLLVYGRRAPVDCP